jgi:hypothetical protein
MKGRIPAHLQDVLAKPEPEIDGADDDRGLPSQTDGKYLPYGRPANKHLVSIHFITPDGRVRSFQYRHLDSDTRFEHQQITLRFLGFRATTVVIEGQHLWQLYDYIHQDRIPFVREAARNFSEEGKPFVSKIRFIDTAERDRQMEQP